MTKAKAGGEQPVEIPDTLPILLCATPCCFRAIIPIDVGRRRSVRLVEDAIAKERPVIGILTQKDARTEDPGSGDLYMVGCAARILKVIKLAKDNFSVILQGVSRFEVSTFDGAEPFLSAKVRSVPDPTSSDVELDALVMNLKDIAKRVVKLMPELPKERRARRQRHRSRSPRRPDHVAPRARGRREARRARDVRSQDAHAQSSPVPVAPARSAQGSRAHQHAGARGDGPQPARVRAAPAAQGDQEELGELDDGGGDLDEFAEKITKAKMPEEAEKVAKKKQLDRLKGMQPSSAESTRSRARTSSGSSSCRGRSRPRITSSCRSPALPRRGSTTSTK